MKKKEPRRAGNPAQRSSTSGNAAAVAAALQTGFRHHQSGALAQAEALYRQALAHDPDNADALHLLGIACSQQERHGEAVVFIDRALASTTPTAAMYLNLGNALLGTGMMKR